MARPPTGFPGTLTESAPERLGKYPILGVIGKGSMGVIYKSFDPHIKRPVALKTIRRDLVERDCTEDFPARFRQEAQAAGGLSHPGIVAVYEYGEQDEYAYMAMEYVEGRSLRECLEGRVSFSIAQVVDIVSQLLEALQYAHERGVWHRDIKPANILLMSNGRVKLTDFGIARIQSSVLSQLGTIMGTPGFIAPEMYLSDSFDNRIDLFAAGVVLYQLLAGTPPFVGSADKVMFKVCYETPLPPSVAGRLPSLRPFDAVVVRALARRLDDRFATAAQFLEALRQAHAQLNSGPEGRDETVIRPRPSAAGNSRPSTRGPVSQPQSRPPSADAVSTAARNTDKLARVESNAARGPRPLTPEDIARSVQLLAVRVGPIAHVLAKRAARPGCSREQFIAALAAHLSDDAERAGFLRALG